MSFPFTILLPLVFLILSPYFVSLTHSKVARLGISPTTRPTETVLEKTETSDLKFFYYDQILDHFSFTPESYQTFQQRYAVDSKHWAGANASAPILAFLGEEAWLEVDLHDVGFFQDNGPRLKALCVYIEHRYYGMSMPFGSAKEALKNATTLGYLNAAQALADYAAILVHVKEKYSAKHSPIIVVGASYGGMLAAWFRLKYPHIALGALASSAPLLYFEDTRPKYGYYHVITNVFKDVKLILRRFGSNIIFSNGLADPYSVGGVLEDVSDSIVAIKTLKGTHSQDLSTRRKDDPEWLVMQREKEIKIIESWISTYQKDLRGLNMS
ncbi:unnamed protein product [Brassica napus]|nr:unnamed protein product [Brassica napus]